jgi:hypothetical protein
MMLLPVPTHRSGFASNILAGESILSIEFLFPGADIPTAFIRQKDAPLGGKVPVFRSSKKTDFAEHVKNLPPASFAAFEPIFARWRVSEQGKL